MVRLRRARRSALIAACGLSVAIVALVVAVWQGWTARDAEKRQLRAYLVVVPPHDAEDLWMAKPPAYSMVAENGGETPAYLTGRVIHVSTDFLDDMGHIFCPKKALFTSGRIGGGPVFRDKTANVSIDGLTQSDPQVTAALATGQKLILWGRVSYDDVFSEHHWVDFCYYLGSGDRTATPCFDGNEVDGQPPILFATTRSALAQVVLVIRNWQDLIAGLIGAAMLAVTVWWTLSVETRRRRAELRAFTVAIGTEMRQLSDAALSCFQEIDKLLPKHPPLTLPRAMLSAYSQMPPPVVYPGNADKVGLLGEDTAGGIVHFYGQLALIADSVDRTPLLGPEAYGDQTPSQVCNAMKGFLVAVQRADELRRQIRSPKWADWDTHFHTEAQAASARFEEIRRLANPDGK